MGGVFATIFNYFPQKNAPRKGCRTVFEVKQIVSELEGFAITHQRLTFKSEVITDAASLASYEIGPGSTLALVIAIEEYLKICKQQHPVVGNWVELSHILYFVFEFFCIPIHPPTRPIPQDPHHLLYPQQYN